MVLLNYFLQKQQFYDHSLSANNVSVMLISYHCIVSSYYWRLVIVCLTTSENRIFWSKCSVAVLMNTEDSELKCFVGVLMNTEDSALSQTFFYLMQSAYSGLF